VHGGNDCDYAALNPNDVNAQVWKELIVADSPLVWGNPGWNRDSNRIKSQAQAIRDGIRSALYSTNALHHCGLWE
jgi:hypothetical protein